MLLAIVVMLNIPLTPIASGWSRISENIEITVEIIDEDGRPVPYTNVWGYVLPRSHPLTIDGEDLWKIATRFYSSAEFALPALVHRPLPSLIVHPMGDVNGRAKVVIDYQFLEGSDKKRPPTLQVGFAIIKQGYFPARIEFTIKNESRLSGKVVLARDPAQTLETEYYLHEYSRIKYELSDLRLNEALSEDVFHRLEGYRAALEVLAKRAMEMRDNAAAARIYARMQYLPAIRMHNGRVIGFTQADPNSPESLAYLTRAYKLDPLNPYIASHYILNYGAEHFGGNKYSPHDASEERITDFERFLASLQSLMQVSGNEIWPEHRLLYARWHRKSIDPREREKVLPLLEDLYRSEPKFETKENLMRLL